MSTAAPSSTASRLLRSARDTVFFSYEFGSMKRCASGNIPNSIIGLALSATDS